MFSIGASGQDVYNMQAELLALGYDVGPLDGQFGPRTQAALESFQSDQGIGVDGIVGPQTIAALGGAARPPPGGVPAVAPAAAPPPAAGPPPTSVVPAAVGPNATQRDAFARMQNLFAQYNMSDLSDWLWGQITSGASADQVMLALTQTPTYQQRFVGNQGRQAAGFAQLSPATYLATEAQYKATFRDNGLQAPTDPKAYENLFSNDISPSELDANLKTYHTVATTFTPVMRQFFNTHASMNITHDDVYNMFTGNNPDLVAKYAEMTGTKMPSGDELQTWMQQAQDMEKALFHSFSSAGAMDKAIDTSTLAEKTY